MDVDSSGSHPMKPLIYWLAGAMLAFALAALAASEAPDLQPQPQSAKERAAARACGPDMEPYWENGSSHLCLRRVGAEEVARSTL